MIQYGYPNINVDKDEILSLLAEWDAYYCMYAPSTFHMREYYVLESQSHDPDTTMYTEALSGEHVDEYYKTMHE